MIHARYAAFMALVLAACSDDPVANTPDASVVNDASIAPSKDAASPDTSVPDAPTADAAPEASVPDANAPDASTCITAGTELCDDFESGALDMKKWHPPKPNSGVTVTVDDSKAHSGKYAVHIHGVAGKQNFGVIAESVTFPAQNNSFYARVFAYFYPDLPAATGGDFHTGFIVGTGRNALGDVQGGMGLIGGDKQFLGYSIFFGDPYFEFGPWSSTRATPSQWLCLELFEDGSSPDTEARKVWVNDIELKDLESDSAKAGGTAHPNHKPAAFDTVSMGLWEFHPSPTLTDMWIDDARVSRQKIGCAD